MIHNAFWWLNGGIVAAWIAGLTFGFGFAIYVLLTTPLHTCTDRDCRCRCHLVKEPAEERIREALEMCDRWEANGPGDVISITAIRATLTPGVTPGDAS